MVRIKKREVTLRIIIGAIFALFVYVFNGGPNSSLEYQVQSIIFSLIAFTIIVIPRFKNFVFALILLMLISMLVFYFNRDIFKATLFGSSAMGLIIILFLSWLPEILGKGYVSDLAKWFKE